MNYVEQIISYINFLFMNKLTVCTVKLEQHCRNYNQHTNKMFENKFFLKHEWTGHHTKEGCWPLFILQ